jgi:hypothetical protein
MLRRNIRREQGGGGGSRGRWKEVQIKVYGTTKKRSDLKRREKEKTEESAYLGPAPEGLFEVSICCGPEERCSLGLTENSADW